MSEVKAKREEWQKWLADNPDAPEHEYAYAQGVIDGLLFLENPSKDFVPMWQRNDSTTPNNGI